MQCLWLILKYKLFTLFFRIIVFFQLPEKSVCANWIFSMCDANGFFECRFAIFLWRVLGPLFLVIGVIGNVTSIFVLSRRRMCYTTTSVYLRFLAVTDSAVLLASVLRGIIRNYVSFDIRDLNMVLCKTHRWFGSGSASLSTWFVCAITFDRLILLKYPIWAKCHCTRRLALIVGVILSLLTFAIHSHFIFLMELKTVHYSENGTNITQTAFFKCSYKSAGYKTFVRRIWPIYVILAYNIIPAIWLITCNIVLVRHLTGRNRARQERRKLKKTQSQKDLRSITKMLVAISVFFIVAITPVCTYLVILSYLVDSSPSSVAKKALAEAIVKLILYSNNAVNFILYCLTGSVFRKELVITLQQIKSAVQKCIGRKVHPAIGLNQKASLNDFLESDLGAKEPGSSSRIAPISGTSYTVV